MYGELTGSFTPVVLATTLPKLTASLMRAVETRLPGGVQRQAAETLQGSLAAGGEDIAATAAALRESTGAGTAGQVSGSPRLLAIENELVASGGKVSEDIAAQTQKAINEFNAAYRAAITSGDPDLVRQAAQARQDYLVQTLGARVANAEKRARDIQTTNLRTADPAKVSSAARNIL